MDRLMDWIRGILYKAGIKPTYGSIWYSPILALAVDIYNGREVKQELRDEAEVQAEKKKWDDELKKKWGDSLFAITNGYAYLPKHKHNLLFVEKRHSQWLVFQCKNCPHSFYIQVSDFWFGYK